MIGLAAYVGVFAYGRMAKVFGSRAWLIIALVTLATVILSALVGQTPSVSLFVLTLLFQFVILAALFGVGVLFGRFLDRHKGSER